MKVIIEENKKLDSTLCNQVLIDFRNGIKDFFIPAGGTPEGFYAELETRREPEWDQMNFFQVDDIINGVKAGEFKKFFNTQLGKRASQLIDVNENTFPKGEFNSFLGLGVNGHVAFHEPHLPEHFSKGCVELGPRTLKYLSLDKGTWGVTYGLGTFLKSETIYLMVKGEHKIDILKRFLRDDITVPAVALKKHKDLRLLVDKKTWHLLDAKESDLEAC